MPKTSAFAAVSQERRYQARCQYSDDSASILILVAKWLTIPDAPSDALSIEIYNKKTYKDLSHATMEQIVK
jgi:hypothetical protein